MVIHICIDKPCLEWTLVSYINIAIAIPLNSVPAKSKRTLATAIPAPQASLHRRGSSQSEQSAQWSKLCFGATANGRRNLTRTPRLFRRTTLSADLTSPSQPPRPLFLPCREHNQSSRIAGASIYCACRPHGHSKHSVNTLSTTALP
jgi:hypothetical protein